MAIPYTVEYFLLSIGLRKFLHDFNLSDLPGGLVKTCTFTPLSGYNKHSPAASINRGVFIYATWGTPIYGGQNWLKRLILAEIFSRDGKYAHIWTGIVPGKSAGCPFYRAETGCNEFCRCKNRINPFPGSVNPPSLRFGDAHLYFMFCLANRVQVSQRDTPGGRHISCAIRAVPFNEYDASDSHLVDISRTWIGLKCHDSENPASQPNEHA